jgi:hypothetical protein
MVNGQDRWLRWQVVTGVFGVINAYRYQQSRNGSSWRQIGSQVTSLDDPTFNSTDTIKSPGAALSGLGDLYEILIWRHYLGDVMANAQYTIDSNPPRTTLVAHFDVTKIRPGDTTYTDELGNVWTLDASNTIVRAKNPAAYAA